MGFRARFVKSCPNKGCPDYGKHIKNNIISFGFQKNGTPRYKCVTCSKTFSETKNTIHFYKHLNKEEFLSVCRMLADKMSYRSISKKTNRHLDTIRGVASSIRQNFGKLRDYFREDLKLSGKQVKSMGQHLKKKQKAKS